MAKDIITKENIDNLTVVIEKHKNKKGFLIPILHESQKIFGCISFPVQKQISEQTGVPLAEIYGVVTFYSHFSLEPKGDHVVSVCLGTACYVKNAGKVLEDFAAQLEIGAGQTTPDGKFSLEATRCIGACGLAPVLTVNKDVYGRLKADLQEVKDIIAKY